MMKREASQSVRQPLCRLFILCVFIWGCSCSMVRRRSSRGWGRTSFGHGNDKLLLLWTTSAVGRPERRRQTHEHLPHGLLGSGAVLLSDHEDVGWSEIELVRVWIKINTDDAFCGFWFAVKVINTWRARLQFGFCLYVGLFLSVERYEITWDYVVLWGLSDLLLSNMMIRGKDLCTHIRAWRD